MSGSVVRFRKICSSNLATLQTPNEDRQDGLPISGPDNRWDLLVGPLSPDIRSQDSQIRETEMVCSSRL